MKQSFLFIVLSAAITVFAMAFVVKEKEHPDKHLEIVLRNIGHQVLFASKDSTSRVLPVETINENSFRISFEHNFTFVPDSLINLVRRQLAKTDRLGDYTVSVNECTQNKTIFAYEINMAGGDLTPCRGRQQQNGCYVIEISFLPATSFNYAWLLLAVLPLAIAGLYFYRKRTKNSPGVQPTIQADPIDESLPGNDEPAPVVADHQKLGNFQFFESTAMLSLNGETIELSVKEAKALTLLATNINQVVGRDVLMKEIWEDDGVFVISRNVDVLISKLRKRLSGDESVKIVNVHGKGYKMIV